MTDVIVVGGGLTGLCTAAACARDGLDVLLLGQGTLGAGLPPLGTVPAPATEHLDVWRLAGSGFLLDREPVPLRRDGEEIGRVHRVDPVGLHGAWVVECLRLGVAVRLATPVVGLVRFGGGVSGVQTPAGSFAARTTILAAGMRTPRLLAGTPGDVMLGVRVRHWWLLGPDAEAVADGVTDLGEGDWLARDLAGRTYVERATGDGPGLAAGSVLEAGSFATTTTPDGEPIVGPPAWTTGGVIACSGDQGLAAAALVASTVVAGIRDGAWDGPYRATRGFSS